MQKLEVASRYKGGEKIAIVQTFLTTCIGYIEKNDKNTEMKYLKLFWFHCSKNSSKNYKLFCLIFIKILLKHRRIFTLNRVTVVSCTYRYCSRV